MFLASVVLRLLTFMLCIPTKIVLLHQHWQFIQNQFAPILTVPKYKFSMLLAAYQPVLLRLRHAWGRQILARRYQRALARS